jgi:hypothetical protein
MLHFNVNVENQDPNYLLWLKYLKNQAYSSPRERRVSMASLRTEQCAVPITK